MMTMRRRTKRNRSHLIYVIPSYRLDVKELRHGSKEYKITSGMQSCYMNSGKYNIAYCTACVWSLISGES